MIRIRIAKESDSNALIHLTSLTPMKGKISLRIDRQPDFFRLLRERGTFIAIIAETENNEIVGSFTAARQTFLVEQKEAPIYYLGDLKVHPHYSGSSLAFRLVKKMRSELDACDADLVFCTAAEGNDLVMPFFSGKAGIPGFTNISRYNVYQLLPKKLKQRTDYVPESTSSNELESFYQQFFSRYNFRPALQLTSCIHFVKRDSGRIIAALSVTDPTPFKQNVVIDYPVSLKILLSLLKVLKPVFSLPSLPEKNLPLRILYVKYWADPELSMKNLSELISEARDFAFRKNYHFLSLAADEKDERMFRFMSSRRMFVFSSNALLTSLKHRKDLVDRISHGIAYEDFSLV